MEAIILAGGMGTRLRSIIPDLPKPLAPINGRPFLEILLDSLDMKGFSHVILSVGYMGDTIIKHFGSSYGSLKIDYVLEEQPLGTGGAIKLAIEKCSNKHTYIFNGDTYLNLEIEEVELLWQENRDLMIIGREVLDTNRYGRLYVKNGMVCEFLEKGIGGAGFINAGCYVIDPKSMPSFPQADKFSFEEDYLASVVAKSGVRFFKTNGMFIDIGVPEDYFLAQKILS